MAFNRWRSLYYDGTQWDHVWDTTQQTNLPLAIKVQIHMAPIRGAVAQAEPLELVVPLDVLLSTNTIMAYPMNPRIVTS